MFLLIARGISTIPPSVFSSQDLLENIYSIFRNFFRLRRAFKNDICIYVHVFMCALLQYFIC
nr:MAG TPA: hypothetical protein [Bacteriophage sp.]